MEGFLEKRSGKNQVIIIVNNIIIFIVEFMEKKMGYFKRR